MPDFRIEIKWNPDERRFELDGTMDDEFVCYAMLEKAKFSIMRHFAENKKVVELPDPKARPALPKGLGNELPFRPRSG